MRPKILGAGPRILISGDKFVGSAEDAIRADASGVQTAGV
jgi:hypothetical protein